MKGPQRPDILSFAEVAQLLNSSLELHTVLRRLLEGLDRLLGPSHWSLLLRDEPSGDLVFVLVRSEVDRALIGQRLKPGEGIAGWVAERGETLLLPDVAADPRFSPRMDETTSFATRSILAVPLRSGAHVTGVIEVVNALDERQFTPEDVEILQAFANFAAVAIENARIHGALVEANRNDPLTGLRNSTYFLASVEDAVGRGESFALIFFDMDHFKPLVDRHGHVHGSAALAEVGQLMAAALRPGEVGCRFGGDEFSFLFHGADADLAARRAGDFADIIRSHVFLTDAGIHARLEASFGWASYPEDAGTATQLLQIADERMYATKRERKRERKS
jgi:diguanylate cyclase (GGDEF)-like protein